MTYVYVRLTNQCLLSMWNRIYCRPINAKVKAIVIMSTHNNKKGICKFIILIHYYQDMWYRRYHMIQPLAKWMSENFIFRSTSTEQEAFDEIKQIVERFFLYNYQILIMFLVFIPMQENTNWAPSLSSKANQLIFQSKSYRFLEKVHCNIK